MKKLFLILTLAFASYIVDAQIINLVKDDSYASTEDFDFFDALGQAGTLYNVKKLTVFDDGTAMISHTNENRYSLFDENGKHLKDIEIYFEDGKQKPINLQPVYGKINGLYFTRNNSIGHLYFFNDNGLIVKNICIDFSAYDMVAMANNKIALYGGTSWKKQWRYFVAILDVETEKYHLIYDDFEELTMFKDEYVIYSQALINHRIEMVKISDDILAFAAPDKGKLLLYNFKENSLIEKKLDWKPKTLSVDEQKRLQSESIKKYKRELANFQNNPDLQDHVERQREFVNMLENGMNYITGPLTVSWFTSAMKSNGDNILFFEDPEEEGKNMFQTYSVGQNKTISQNSFQCADFDLSITKNKFVIHNGYVYGIQKVKGSEEELRLVRFKMK